MAGGEHTLRVVREQLAEATAAKKCHGCGCLHSTVQALEATDAGRGELKDALERTRAAFTPKKYDCLGCEVCFPAVAANAFAEAFPKVGARLDLCPTDTSEARAGWPPLPGDYHVVRFRAPVAACTLNSADLAARLAALAPEGLSIAGTMHTENLGIERIIRNAVANPNIRFLVLCGEDTRQAVGHLPGQSLESLFAHGLDDDGRIIGARGRRPLLRNVSREQVAAFRTQVELVSRIGENSEETIAEAVRGCAGRAVPPLAETVAAATVETVRAGEPRRLQLDPAGFFVVYPDPRRGLLAVEHYTNAGVLDRVIEGSTPAAIYGQAVGRGLVSRLDHAAYLGQELARAERSLRTGEPYVQDRAPGGLPRGTTNCGCTGACGGAA